MIVFQGQGGLGNQLFQYAAARRLAFMRSTSLVIDPYWFAHPRRGETARPLELTRYAVKMRAASPLEQVLWWPLRSRWAKHLPAAVLPLRLIREQGHSVNQKVLEAPDNIYLSGFWQSESYFADIRDKLLQELVPTAPPSPQDIAVMESMRNTDSVSVHVRRGDYVTLKSAADYHGLCSLNYYREAINYVAQRVRQPNLFIFSDDPQWCRENLRTAFPTVFVDHNTSDQAFQDLRLMTCCKHHILANSSFSWWGAWLSQSTGGTIVAPQRWYAHDRPTPDLIPARWTRIAA